MQKVVINHEYTFESDITLEIGDLVALPTPQWLRDVKGNEWIGKVTALESKYLGPCAKVIRKID